jgi:galactokinase
LETDHVKIRDIMTDSASVRGFATGRVNLLGEHTDYNQGLVLPTAIPQRTEVVLQPREDRRVSAQSAIESSAAREYELGQEQRGRGWLDYVQGVTRVLSGRGHALSGFALRVQSQIPTGSGLSSSAALLIALLRALREAFALPLSDLALAQLAQQVENEFVGAPVGILDPLACSLCEAGRALFIDTRTLFIESLALPASIELVVIHSGISHTLAAAASHGADYRTRRGECERAAEQLGVPSLRELDEADLCRVARLPAPLPARVRHVITENARVREAVEILRRGAASEEDLHRLGALFAASHRSQREDYEVSLFEIDRLVEISAADLDIVPGAARLTGGGFGGSIVALARRGRARIAARRIADEYERATGQRATILVPPFF